jgi:hypothetical protein
MHDLVTWLLAYLAIGALLWALNDPSSYLDFTIRYWIARRGIVPSRGMLLLSVAVAILMWPKAVVAIVSAVAAGLKR